MVLKRLTSSTVSGLHLEIEEGGGGQICEQGSFEGAGLAHGKLGGSGGMFPQKVFEKRHVLRSILVHFWLLALHVLHISTCVSLLKIWGGGGGGGGGGGERLPRGAFAPRPPKCNPDCIADEMGSQSIVKYSNS